MGKKQKKKKESVEGLYAIIGVIILICIFKYVIDPVFIFVKNNYSLLLVISALLIPFAIVGAKQRMAKNHAKEMIERIQTLLSKLYEATSASDFMQIIETANKYSNELMLYKEKVRNPETEAEIDSVRAKIIKSDDERFQWLLRDSIERQKETTIKLMKTTYKNSQTYKESRLQEFSDSVLRYKSVFNDETLSFANSCVDEIALAAGKDHGQSILAKEQRKLLTPSMRYDVLKRDGFRCTICGRGQEDGVKLHVDHILPVSKGGKTTPSNLRTLCQDCNLGKSDKYEDGVIN